MPKRDQERPKLLNAFAAFCPFKTSHAPQQLLRTCKSLVLLFSLLIRNSSFTFPLTNHKNKAVYFTGRSRRVAVLFCFI